MPAVLANTLLPETDLVLIDTKGLADLLLGEKRARGANTVQFAQQEDEDPTLKAVTGFPNQTERATQRDLVVVCVNRRDRKLRVLVRLSTPGTQEDREGDASRPGIEVTQELTECADQQSKEELLIQALQGVCPPTHPLVPDRTRQYLERQGLCHGEKQNAPTERRRPDPAAGIQQDGEQCAACEQTGQEGTPW